VLSYVKDGSVLDMGCGTGHLALACLGRGNRVLAVDISPEMTGAARKLASEHGFTLETLEMDVERGIAPIAGRSFDTIVCLDVLEHLDNDKTALKDLVSLLRPEGVLIVVVPAVPWLYGVRDMKIGHRRRYRKRDLVAMLREAGLRTRVTRYWGLLGFFAFFVFEKVLRKPVPEDFRYSNKARWRNELLSLWYKVVENPLPMPVGLSLVCVAVKDQP
jgi:SAM-dependent methyltransferase